MYRFPFGTIVALGLVTSPVFYRIAVVGGTGYYRNIGGQVSAQAYDLEPKRERLYFQLQAF